MQNRCIITLLLVICLVFSSMPFTADAAGTSFTATVPAPGESAEFSFVPEKTGLYHITSQADSPTACIVFAADNTALNEDYGSGDNGNFSLRILLIAGKTYYFSTHYNDPGLTGSYTVTLDYLGMPVFHSLSQDVTTAVTVTQDAPAAYYSFTPTVSGQYTLQAASDGDTYCRLYDANWNSISYGDDNGEGRDFVLTYALIAGETYYFEVRYYSNTAGTFQIQLTGMGIKALGLDTPTTVTISESLPAAYYSFTPTRSGYYSLRADSGGFDTICSLYDQNGNFLSEGDDSETGLDFDLVAKLTAGETYYYEVQFFGNNAVGNFTILLTYLGDPENVALMPDIPVTVTVPVGGLSIFCSFTPEANGTYTITANSQGMDTVVWLYDEEGYCLAHNDDSDSSNDFSLTYALNAGKTYTYEVAFYGTNKTGSFDILLTQTGQQELIPLSLDVPITLEIPANGSVFCTFTPTESGYYALSTDTLFNEIFFRIFDSSGNMLYDTTFGYDEEYNLDFLPLYPLKAGETYTYELYCSAPWETGSPTILLTWAGPDDPYVLSPGNPLDVCIYGYNLPAECIFTPAKSGDYTFTVDTQGRPMEIFLCDAYGNLLCIEESDTQSNSLSITYPLDAGTTYTYKVRYTLVPENGIVSVLLTQEEVPQERILEQDVLTHVTVENPGEILRYKFVPEVSGYYTLTASSDVGGTFCELYRQNGSNVASIAFQYDIYERSDFRMYYYLMAGTTYYYDVSYARDTRVGEFDILLQYSGINTASGKVGNNMIRYYTMDDFVLGEDGVYRLPDGSSVYIAVDNRNDGGVAILGSFTPMELVTLGGEYADLTHWDALTALMDEDGYVLLTEDTLMYATSIATSVEIMEVTEAHVPLLFFYDYPPVPKPVPGDVNLDGKVDGVDAYLVVQYYAEKITLTEEQLLWADVDGNGRVDMADAYTITLLFNTAGN